MFKVGRSNQSCWKTSLKVLWTHGILAISLATTQWLCQQLCWNGRKQKSLAQNSQFASVKSTVRHKSAQNVTRPRQVDNRKMWFVYFRATLKKSILPQVPQNTINVFRRCRYFWSNQHVRQGWSNTRNIGSFTIFFFQKIYQKFISF